MDFGISFLPDSNPSEKTASQYYEDVLDIAVLAESLGFSYCKMTEHYLSSYGGYCPDPLMFLTAVAERTKSMRLMTGAIIPAYHNPIEVAAKTGMLDVLSGGRLEVGLARGYMPFEFDAFGIDMDSSRQRFEETAELLPRLWSGEKVSFHSRCFSLDSCQSFPLPLQETGPRLWGAAVRSRESFSWLGEHGFNLLVGLADLQKVASNVNIYRESSSLSKDQLQVFISLPLLIRPTDEQALHDGEKQLAKYLDTWASAADSWSFRRSEAYKSYTNMAAGLRAQGVEGLLKGAIVGSPMSCVKQMKEMMSLIDLDGVLFQLDFGSASRESMEETVRLFTEEVRGKLV